MRRFVPGKFDTHFVKNYNADVLKKQMAKEPNCSSCGNENILKIKIITGTELKYYH
jgi:hypothetical protein